MRSTTKLIIIHSPVWMVLVGLAARVVYMVIAHSYQAIAIGGPNGSVNELERLAYSLATGSGFSAPYVVDTGPSAWAAPIYPWLISLAFRAFGVYSNAAGVAMLLFNSICAALTSWTLYRIARRVFNESVAVWSGWVWAFLPYSIRWSVAWVSETTFSAFLLSLLFMLTLEMEDNDGLWWWSGYGLLWGIAALTNTAVISFLPFSGCWLAYQLHRHGKRFLVPVMFSAAVFWLTLMPWLVRNYYVFGEPVFIRDNFGTEFRAGNNPQAEGWKARISDAPLDPLLLSEAAISSQQADEAKAWIAQHPQRFLVLCFRRFIFFWAGLPVTWAGLPVTGLKRVRNLVFLASSLLSMGGLWLAFKRRVHGVFLFATLLLFYPLTYYITVPEPRYRHAIEPELVILSVFLLLSLSGGQKPAMRQGTADGAPPSSKLGRPRRLRRWIGGAIAIGAIILALTLINNNFSFRRQSRDAFKAQGDRALENAIAWIAANPAAYDRNPTVMYFVSEIEAMSGDPRLLPVLDDYRSYVAHPRSELDFVWARIFDPLAPVPRMTARDLRFLGVDPKWYAYGIAPNQLELTSDELAGLYSPDRYHWGTRLHQLMGLNFYRRFNGSPPEMDRLINHLADRVAQEAHYDFRMNDGYIQRTAFVLAAGRPDLIRRRWVERILDYQKPDGSWDYCWYGWCRGVFEFGFKYNPGHATVQAAWALAMLKYRYPHWAEEHYQ